MPKMKTHKGIAKRMKRTRKGTVTRSRANRGHLMSGKRGKRKRRLRKKGRVVTKQARAYARLLGS